MPSETMPTLELIGQAHALQGDSAIRPTVLIGLGGSGKEVLMRLRRLSYEKNGTVGLPIMQYLWFDTDTEAVDIHRQAYDEINRQLYFDSDEQVSGKIEPAQLAQYYRQSNQYEQIFNWFNRDALEILGTSAFTQGARQIRPFGRLAFFHSYPTLRTALEQKIDAIGADAQEITRRMGHRVNSTIEIVIVSSLAGGTGSGSLIDMAFLAKELAPNAIITGLFFLPQIFEGNPAITQEVLEANGYAALKELDYYLAPTTFGKNSGQTSLNFAAKWDGELHTITGPPFTTVYLIDNDNHLGVGTKDHTDVFQMAAESLMLDFDSSPFAAAKRCHRSNMEPFLHTETQYSISAPEDKGPIHVQYFPNRYSAFGLSQIQTNQPQIAHTAAYKLAEYMVRFWLTDREVHAGYEEVSIRQHLDPLGLTIDRLVADLLAHAFGKSDQQAIDNQFRKITSKIGQKQREMNETLLEHHSFLRTHDDGVRISQHLNREMMALESFVEEIRNETENLITNLRTLCESNLQEYGTIGPHIRIIQENKARRERELQESLEEVVIRLLSNPASQGTSYVERFLDAAQLEIHRLIEDSQSQITPDADKSESKPISSEIESHAALKIEDKGDFTTYQRRIQEATRIPVWAGFLFARHARAMALNYYEQKLTRAIHTYFRNNLRALEESVNEEKKRLKEYVEGRYRREALKRLTNPQLTGILNRLHAQLGSRVEITNRDGTTTIKSTGLRQELNLFMHHLIELRDDFRRRSEACHVPQSSERNLSVLLHIDYLEEILAYLALRLNTPKRVEILTRISNVYFLKSGIIESNESQPTEGETIDGLREIYHRATRHTAHPMGWEQIRESLEAFVLDEMRDLKAKDKASEHLSRSLKGDAEQIQGALANQVKRGALRVQRPELSLMEFAGIRSLSLIGISDTDDSLCTQVRDLDTNGENPYQHASVLAYAKDSIVFFTEQVAFPIFYVGGLRDVRNSYIANIRSNPNHIYWRHFEQDYQKYRDILPPTHSDDALRMVEGRRGMLEGLILGNIRYAQSRGIFYLPGAERGIQRRHDLGATIQESADVLSTKQDIRDGLIQSNRRVHEQWSREKLIDKPLQLLCIYQYLIETVYPDNLHTVILGESVHLTNMNYLVMSTLYEGQWDNIKAITKWTDEQISAELESYDVLDTFSVTLDYQDAEMQGQFRLLRRSSEG